MTFPLTESMDSIRSHGRTYRYTRLFRITRVDGRELLFTEHDRPITTSDGIFSPAGGLDASAVQRGAQLQEQNRTFRGMITSDDISSADLAAGLYRNAMIEDWIVDWKYPWAGNFSYSKYWVTETEFDGEVMTAEVSGQTMWLQQAVGGVNDLDCPHDLFDGNCTLSKASYTSALATVTQASGTTGGGTILDNRRIISTNLTIQPDGYYEYGNIEFVSGANAGLSFELKKYTAIEGIFELQIQTPYDVEPSDTFNAVAGCDKLKSTCKSSKFNNFTNFGGMLFMPGSDAVNTVIPLDLE